MLKRLFNRAQYKKEKRELKQKEDHELKYWRRQKANQGVLVNDHYEKFYTTFFGINPEFYAGKRIVDVGCGPRGSLEWAVNSEAYGVDPLADRYRELGTDAHRMTYVNAGAEKMPFPAAHFDAVFSFNNFDHVERTDLAAVEIARVLKPAGLFLLIVELNHVPTVAEPHTLSADVVNMFGLTVEDIRLYKSPGEHACYSTISDEKNRCEDDGSPMWLCAKMTKR